MTTARTPLYLPFDGPRLTVNVHLAEGPVPAWIAATLDAMASADSLDVHWHRAVDEAPRRPDPLSALCLRLERRLLGPLGRILVEGPLPGAIVTGMAGRAPDRGIADVVLGVGTRPPSRGRLATWCLPPEALDPCWIPPHVQDAFRAGGTSALSGLEVEDLASGERRLLDVAEVSMSRLSLLRNAAYQLQKAPAKLLRALRRLARGDAARDQVLGVHAPRALLPLVAAAAWRALPRHAGLAGGREHWFTLVRRSPSPMTPDAPDGSRFRVLDPGDGGFLADPCPWTQDGRTAVFAEALAPGGKGEIHAIELGPDDQAVRRHVVVASPFHHSYPFLYATDDGPRMLVECAESREIRRWRCERFPDRWHPDGALMTGWRAVDATVLRHGSRWWIFCCIAESPFDDGGREWDDLFAFHGPGPDGPWTPHAANPIVQGVHHARPAGAFVHRDGRLFRPAQDGAREYGHRIVFHEVERLDPDTYVEVPAGTLGPDGFPGVRGVHTWAERDGLEVIDAKVITHDRRPQWQAAPGAFPLALKASVATLAALLLLVLTLAPLPDVAALGPILGALHVPVSLVLIAGAGEWMESRRIPRRYALLALCVPLVGTFSELLQVLTPWRVASTIDIALNLIGGLLGLVLHRLRPTFFRTALSRRSRRP